MSKTTSFLYQLARAVNDIEKLARKQACQVKIKPKRRPEDFKKMKQVVK